MAWRRNLRVVLVRSRNSLNIGAAARAMFNFGFSDLWLVEPYTAAFRKARSAVGATEVLKSARVTDDLAEAMGESSLVVGASGIQGRVQRQVRRSLPDAGHALRTHLQNRPAALVFGSEQSGLSNEQLSYCDWVLNIPTTEDCPSMNLGQAVALCCYEISRVSRSVPKLKTPTSVSAIERHRVLEMLTPILEESGFIIPGQRASKLLKIRRWIGRLRLAPADARLLMGMLRQIDWKLQRDKRQ